MSNFRIGQKVVCVNDSNGGMSSCLGAGYDHGLRKDEVYTIKAVNIASSNGPFVSLAEMRTNAWHHSRFRPVIERKTDIDVFRRLLVPSKELISIDQ